MVLTKSEFISQLQHEVHILLHLASKVDRNKLDYRPTPKQRSTLELLQYLSRRREGLFDWIVFHRPRRQDAEEMGLQSDY